MSGLALSQISFEDAKELFDPTTAAEPGAAGHPAELARSWDSLGTPPPALASRCWAGPLRWSPWGSPGHPTPSSGPHTAGLGH